MHSRPVIVTIALAALALFVASILTGCISVDKSVHVYADIKSDKLSRVEVQTRTENTSDTQADGNSPSAEADLSIPLLP